MNRYEVVKTEFFYWEHGSRVKLEEKKLSSDFNEDFRQSHSLTRRISDIVKKERIVHLTRYRKFLEMIFINLYIPFMGSG